MHVFSLEYENRFSIVVICVDNVNTIGTLEGLPKTMDWLKK